MGEDAAASCLIRSVSQPLFASCELKEGDPLRALTTSISFGRFMTEPLNWERWSSFSHNRILEDVKKYSIPGAVAEKKAFFEAHYKNFAAKKLPQKENHTPNYSPQTNVTISNTHSPIGNTRIDENVLVESEIASNEDVCSRTSNNNNLSSSDFVYDDESVGDVGQESTSAEANNDNKMHNKGAASDADNKLFGPEISWVRNGAYKKIQNSRKVRAAEIRPKTVALIKNETSSKILGKPKDSNVTRVKKNSQVLPRTENKWAKPLLDCTTNGNRTGVLKSLSTNQSEAPNVCKKPRSTTTFSSFSFKSDQRAAKRKEFFEKLAQKSNTEKMEETKLQPKLKEKARSGNKELRCRTTLEAKCETRVDKVSKTQLGSPKPRRKPTRERVQEDTCSQSPWKSSSLKTKNFIEINKKKLVSLMACLPAKKMLESNIMSRK
ncbi:protein WVD2-like 7 [Rutidosis leptorrhynchoides]|uniref:protein WVD2-like 7 n=1 Tax=Rutidosis leptorrhynchoides TaxID=125765 RepID=UPI003A9977C2